MDDIFGIALPVQVLVLAFVFFLTLDGTLPDQTYVREDATVRHSLGFT